MLRTLFILSVLLAAAQCAAPSGPEPEEPVPIATVQPFVCNDIVIGRNNYIYITADNSNIDDVNSQQIPVTSSFADFEGKVGGDDIFKNNVWSASIKAGQQSTLKVVVAPAADAAPAAFTLSVGGVECSAHLVREFDLRMSTVHIDDDIVAGGGEFHYHIEFENHGPSDAVDVTVKATFSTGSGSGAVATSVIPSPTATSPDELSEINWQLPRLAAGAHVKARVEFEALADLRGPVRVVASIVAAGGTTLTPVDDVRRATAAVEAHVDLVLTKGKVSIRRYKNGGDTRYELASVQLHATNKGPSSASNVIIREIFESTNRNALEFKGASATKGEFVGGAEKRGGWFLGDLENGETATLTLNYRITKGLNAFAQFFADPKAVKETVANTHDDLVIFHFDEHH